MFFLESRWDPPPTGFVSIEEQERLDSKEKNKHNKKAKVSSKERKKLLQGCGSGSVKIGFHFSEYGPNPDPGVKTVH
jgi:hypothetical protein